MQTSHAELTGLRRRVIGLFLLLVGLAAGVHLLVVAQGPGYRTPRPAGSLPSPLASTTDAVGRVADPPGAVTTGFPRGADSLRPVEPRSVVQAPDRLVLPRFGVEAAVVPVAISASGAMDVPEDPRVLGWWNESRPLNSGRGSLVIVGHVDSATRGKGAFFRLERAAPGDTVRLDSGQRTALYRVVARRVYPKTRLPQGIFTRSGPPYLVLITCGGPFDKRSRHYRDNVVVYALPA